MLDRREEHVTDLSIAVRATLEGRGQIQRDEVIGWCRAAEDLESLHLLYRLTAEGHERIHPHLGQQESCELIQRYLLACVRLDPREDGILTRYEAAQTLVGWFQHLSSLREDTTLVLGGAAAAVTKSYLEGDGDVKLAIETGFLEHLLEDVEFRPLFSAWAEDDRLRKAWHAALAWGEAHPGFTRSLLRGPSRK